MPSVAIHQPLPGMGIPAVSACLRCGRLLTDPDSIARGFGPVCIGYARAADRKEAPTVTDPYDPETGDITCRRDEQGRAITNVEQRHRHHSPTGFEWGSDLLDLVNLDMAVRTKQVEPLRVVANFLNPDGTGPLVGRAAVHMVEVERRRAPVVPAAGAPASKHGLQVGPESPLLVAPAFLFAPATTALPTLVTFAPEHGSALDTEAVSAHINAGAPVFFVRGHDLPALGAPAILDAPAAIRGLAIFSVRDALAASLAVERWVRSHSTPPPDHYTNVEYKALRESGVELYGGSGPADFALNIMALYLPVKHQYDDDSEGDPSPVMHLESDGSGVVKLWGGSHVSFEAWEVYQDFKWAFVAALPFEGGTIPGDIIRGWITGRLGDRS